MISNRRTVASTMMRRATAAGAAMSVLLAAVPSRADAPLQVECSVAEDKNCSVEVDFDALSVDLKLRVGGVSCSDTEPPRMSLKKGKEPPISCTSEASGNFPGLVFTCKSGGSPTGIGEVSGVVSCGETEKAKIDLKRAAATPKDDNLKKPESVPQPPPLGSLPPGVWAEILGRIGVPLGGARLGSYYSRREDVAVLFFNKAGVPFFPIPDIIDEDDDVYVVVVDRFMPEAGTLTEVPISLSGCNRPPLDARINGAISGAVAQTGGVRSAGAPKPGEPPQPELRYFIYPYGKCAGAASGGPQLKIDQQTTTISVNPLYRFSVGVAAAYDNTAVREFSLRTPPGDGIARIAQADDRIGLSSLIYISFYPVARDFRKTDFFLAQRLQLFVGLDPRAFDEHLVGGVGYELTMGLNALVGWRFLTRQPVLAEGSGLSVGDAFDGTAESLPTRKRWETGSFFLGVGLSSDLLARLR